MSNIDYEQISGRLNNTLAIHTSFGKALKEVRRVVKLAGRYDDPQVAVILGESRAGKTRVLETIISENPTVTTPEGLNMPIVGIRVLKGTTTNGVLSLILNAMGDKFTGRGTETDKLIRLLGFVEKLKVKVIIIDEFQHLVRFNKKSEFDTADALKVLADLASVNLIVAGIEYARKVIDANPQLAGRARNPVVIKRFDWRNQLDRLEFIAITTAFAKTLSPLRLPDFGDEDWGFRWYCATGGLVGYIAKIFKEILDNAEEENATVITMNDLHIAHETTFKKEDSIGTLWPFTSEFNPVPTEDTLYQAWSVGRDDEHPADTSTNR